jgi:NAD(P)-dependent dehydrogenase (short-subunit alcohol dehydrogenase family)
MGQLDGQVALVTGASRGIGESIALLFACEGADLILAARSRADLQRVAAAAGQYGHDVLVCPTDLTRATEVEALVEAAETHYGHIDILVNNAGVGIFKPLPELTPQEWTQTLDINLTALFLCSRAVMPGMVQRQCGQIINISSQAGLKSPPGAGSVAYTAAKWGAVGFTRALAMELKPHGVRVSVVCPGSTDTYFRGVPGLPEHAHLLKPDQVAQAVLYVAAQPAGSVAYQIGLCAQAEVW